MKIVLVKIDFFHSTVNTTAGSRSIECPKLVHKSSRRSFERANYTPVRLEKKFDEFERKRKVEDTEMEPVKKHACKSLQWQPNTTSNHCNKLQRLNKQNYGKKHTKWPTGHWSKEKLKKRKCKNYKCKIMKSPNQNKCEINETNKIFIAN